ncbi:MAG: dihydrolipoyllysine-residue acetyltransferase [Proteobacteria bacterium]|nr:dihydrolipoyllysine-residue acetyltransferase [Pseudomonadota bacterium]
MADSIDIKVPDLGDFADVEVIEVLVKAGDRIAREDGLITLETDKASMDVPATDHGVIEELTVAVGDKVSTGDIIGRLAVEVGDTVVVTPAIEANLMQGDTTVIASPATDAAAPAGKKTLSVPDLGDFSDVDVIEVHIAAGDDVAVDDPLITLETDKAAMDVPAVVAGKIEAVLLKVGDTVSQGSPIAVIDAIASAVEAVGKTADKVAPPAAKPPPPPKPAEASAAPAGPSQSAATLPPIDEAGFSKAHASPSVRKLARELGVNLIQVKGSGLKNRVLHDDIKAFVKAILAGGAQVGGALPKVPVVDFAKFGEIESKALTRIQKIAGPRLQASWINIPHVTQHDLADITDLEAKRQALKGPARERGISLTPLAFILKACVAALREFPKVNSSLSEDGTSLIHKNYYHLGFAADTENGLMVPVIHDADKMDVYELAKELGKLSALAREGKLKAAQLQGASFTVSSLGGIGGSAFTPIINAPEVAILGVSRSSMQPVWNGSRFEPRLMLPFSLSYDHRVIDGAYAVRFTTFLSKALSDVDVLLEATP